MIILVKVKNQMELCKSEKENQELTKTNFSCVKSMIMTKETWGKDLDLAGGRNKEFSHKRFCFDQIHSISLHSFTTYYLHAV